MTKSLKKKTLLLVVVICACLVAMGVLLNTVQKNLTFANYDKEFSSAIEQLPGLLEAADDETKDTTDAFNHMYQSKADAVVFMANNNTGFEKTNEKLAELANILQVDNIIITDRQGNIQASAAETKSATTRARFNRLRQVFDGVAAPEPVTIDVENGDVTAHYYYYGSKLDDESMVIVEQKNQELNDLLELTSSEANVLSNISVGEHGYVFAVSARNHLVTYHPDEKLVGADCVDVGLKSEDVKDGARLHATVDGENVYCAISKVDDTNYIFAVPESEMGSSRRVTVGIILFSLLAVIASVALYGVFVMGDDAAHGEKEKTDRLVGGLVYNETVGAKVFPLAVIGILLVLGVSFYMQTLFALSSQSIANAERLEQINSNVQTDSKRAEELTDQYKQWYLTKARIVAYAVQHNSELSSKAKLAELGNVLGVESIYIFDGDGNMTSSSTAQRSYTLSTDPEDSSYPFRELLSGRVDELAQDVSTDEITGEARQYSAVNMYDAAGYATGFVQVAVRPVYLESLLKSLKVDAVLDDVKVGTDGFAFAVNKKDETIAYHPKSQYIGKKYDKAGMTEDMLTDGYSNYITMGGDTYYATSLETSNYYLYVMAPEGELMNERVPLMVLAGIGAAVCLALVFLILTFDVGESTEEAAAAELAGGRAEDEDARNIKVTLADGSRKESESAVSRWLNRSFSWEEKTPGQKLGYVLRWLGGILAILVLIGMLFGTKIFDSHSVFSYILNGNWKRGINIFAITASVMCACSAIAVGSLIRWVLRITSNMVGARGETICRLLESVVEYGVLLVMLYWCLGVLGVDTATLLASAGILTLAIGFGAQQIVNDIMSGLFMIFEGEFRVGDIIEAGGCTGTVMDIGVRTTKIKDGNDNVLVIRNSNISNVTNKTRMNSSATCDFKVPLGESLTYMENALEKELPHIKSRVPAIMDGPFYKGIVALDETYATVRVVATCSEKNRGGLERTLKREMMLMLSRYNVAPFETLVDHSDDIERQEEGPTFQDRLDQAKADRFSAAQKEAAEDLGNTDSSQS